MLVTLILLAAPSVGAETLQQDTGQAAHGETPRSSGEGALLSLPSQHPVSLFHSHSAPWRADALAGSSFTWSILQGITNTLNRKRGYFLVDGETRETLLAGCIRIDGSVADTHDSAFCLEQGIVWFGGGHTDRPIEAWHDFFGLPNGQRDHVPADDSSMMFTDDDGIAREIDAEGTNLLPTRASLQKILARGPGPLRAIAIRPVFVLPTGSGAFDIDRPDFELDVSTDWELGPRLSLSVGGDYLRVGDAHLGSDQGVRTRSNQFGAFGALTFTASPIIAVNLLMMYESERIDDVPLFPDFGSYLELGAHAKLSSSISLHFAIRENPYPDKSTSDFSLIASAGGGW